MFFVVVYLCRGRLVLVLHFFIRYFCCFRFFFFKGLKTFYVRILLWLLMTGWMMMVGCSAAYRYLNSFSAIHPFAVVVLAIVFKYLIVICNLLLHY